MGRAARVCSEPGCPELTDAGRCTTHRREADRARGTREQRGYDSTHRNLRKRWAPRVARGGVHCWRCGAPIASTDVWDLGHDDADRTKYQGPEHARCNRATAGRTPHGA